MIGWNAPNGLSRRKLASDPEQVEKFARFQNSKIQKIQKILKLSIIFDFNQTGRTQTLSDATAYRQ